MDFNNNRSHLTPTEIEIVQRGVEYAAAVYSPGLDAFPDGAVEMPVGSLRAVLTAVGGSHALAIRGSTNARNWTRFNLLFRPDYDDYQGFKVGFHRGFLRGARFIKGQLDELFMQGAIERKSIHLCGHSLGGAIAEILSILLRLDGWTILSCVTAGAPRIFNQQGAQLYEVLALHRSLFRLVHDSDVVANLPPAEVGAWHPYSELSPGRSGALIFSDQGELYGTGASIWGAVSISATRVSKILGLVADSIDDHAMAHYLKAAKSLRSDIP